MLKQYSTNVNFKVDSDGGIGYNPTVRCGPNQDNSSVTGSPVATGSRVASHSLPLSQATGDSSALYALPDNDFTRGELAKMPLRFQKKVRVEWNGCWMWTGHTHKTTGYGEIKIKGNNRKTTAHRFAYMTLIGPIPNGVECDHMCGRRACTNPYHVQLITHAKNMRKYSARVRSLLGKALDNVVESLSGDRVYTGTGRTLSDVVELFKSAQTDGVSLAQNRDLRYRETPYMLVSKLCKACGTSKKLWHFYRVKDWSASDQKYWYPSNLCKPCHKDRCSHNRRQAKAKARGEM